MNRVIIISILLLNFSLVWAQQESPDVRRGNKEYNRENYTEAEVNYRRGLEQNSNSFEGCFNLGDALFRQEKYPEALEQYQSFVLLALVLLIIEFFIMSRKNHRLSRMDLFKESSNNASK